MTSLSQQQPMAETTKGASTTTKRLRLRISNDDHGKNNLFVRLSPQVVQEFLSMFCCRNDDDDDDEGSHHHQQQDQELLLSSWQHVVQPTDVNFLPLRIQLLLSDSTIFASYNGGTIDAMETIEIPRALLLLERDSTSSSSSNQFPPRNNSYNHHEVVVQVLPSIPYCARVRVEPWTVEDWELLETYATELEQGHLLKQVSVVYTGQHLTLWLGRRQKEEKAHVQVTEVATHDDIFWPGMNTNNDYDDDFHHSSTATSYGLLRQDSEVIIAPKPRSPPATLCWSMPLRLIPCRDDHALDDPVLNILAKHDSYLPHVPPGCIMINSKDWAKITITTSSSSSGSIIMWGNIISASHRHGKKHLVTILPSLEIPEQNAALHPWIRFDLGLSLHWDQIVLQPLAKRPAQVSLDNVQLVEISCSGKTTKSKSWRQPNLGAVRNHVFHSSVVFHGTEDERVNLALGSLVPRCFFQEEEWFESERIETSGTVASFFRIVANKNEEKHDDTAFEFLLSQKNERVQLLQRYLDAKATTEEHNDHSAESIATSSIDNLSVVWSPSCVEYSLSKCYEGLVQDWNGNMMITLGGPVGSGKTYNALLLSFLASLAQHRAVLYLNCQRLQESSTKVTDILTEIDRVFDDAVGAQSCVVILDDLDQLIPNLLGDGAEGSHGGADQYLTNPTAIDQSKLIADRILQLMESASSSPHFRVGRNESTIDLTVVATCSNSESLNPVILRTSCYSHKDISIPVLSQDDRVGLLRRMIHLSTGLERVWDVDEVRLGRQTENFRPRDLEKLAIRVQQELRTTTKSSCNYLSMNEVLNSALTGFTPLHFLGLQTPRVASGPTWSNIGGLLSVKAKLESLVLHPAKYRVIYEQAAVRLPRGVLLFGPSGCGKSALVPALAKECGIPLISCKGPEILDKYIGASEAKVRELFQRAAAVAPSILFLDELDALATRRGTDNTGVTDRVVNQLLTFLDGVEESSAGTVYVFGATSRPDKIDPALLRPGRLEEHLFVGPPDTMDEWDDLFSRMSKDWILSHACQDVISSREGLRHLLQPIMKTQRFSPVDVKALLDTAHIHAVHRALQTAESEELEHIEIEMADFTFALKSASPCTSEKDFAELNSVYSQFKPRRKGAAEAGPPKPKPLKTTLR